VNSPPKLRGVIVPVVTPFTPRGDLDAPAIGRIVDRCAAAGVGVFVLGTTGEAASIAAHKRSELVRAVVVAAHGRVPVYAGIGDNSFEDSVAAGNDYLLMGVNAVVAHLPSYYSLQPPGMRAYFELLADQIRGPLILYNIPQTTQMSIPLDVVEALSHRPAIVGLKDSENMPERMEETARRLAGRADFSIFMGTARLATEALRLGYDGLVPGSGNLVPELWQELYRHARAGRWPAAEALQERLDTIAQVFQRDRSLGDSLAALKVAMTARGLCGPTVLPPLQTLNGAACEAIKKELAALDLG
jgi:4-hydroxy-tetrahydrodipicolinate synthase